MDFENNIKESYKDTNILFGDSDYLNLMNHGYHPISKVIENDDSILLKNSSSLYFHLLSKFEIYEDEKILDIGCGRGGGLKNLQSKYKNNKFYGCDNCRENIDYCTSKNININFKVSNALDLEYEEKYFNIVLNVESSHCYLDKEKFFNEVYRVLDFSGYFLYADIFTSIDDINNTRTKLKEIFEICEEEDITINTKESCINLRKTIFEEIKKTEKSEEIKKYYNAYKYLYFLYDQKVQMYKNNKTYFWIFVCRK